MHPALSVIVFTTASGVGYGLLALLGVLAAARLLPDDGGFGLIAVAIGLAFVAGGLLSSTVHLGRPERAWRALSQWRTSWLSREGVLAILTFVPAGLFWLAWLLPERNPALVATLGILTAMMALATIACTAMIYASLKTIHQWHNAWVLPNYLTLAALTGALWLNALLTLWGEPRPMLTLAILAIGLLALWAKLNYWRFIDTTRSSSTPGTATGLSHLGPVRLFEAPHTEENYLLKEMGFRIARKHAARLRIIAVTATFALPLVLTAATATLPPAFAIAATLLAALLASLGALVERWLFFAEAKHTVMLYYGASRV